ncbi:acetate kinase [Ameyamaea chiangmaiensis NBRC 103196]|uniref:Acetate kinase n=1 Tax=Ameyamaea chiangmaiensis TaxID=442969 RepID=A0A850PGZ6_9PROT|nr:acetate/propionate family kinase [Ameyamaea chiangmaiensis]MBS4073839.1 acetate/propionate family kinase [Ameyamaea chiangmaiensis]NVN41506.1 acetate/propionate family kinase [Ameyamaea chiangmaiensis]GBQ68235.1 acetate kinase [Ameyamaea chiangmaiensis NBRC 103196]
MPPYSAEAGAVLALNAGSSSVKFAVYPAGPEARPLARGEVEIGGARPGFVAYDRDGKTIAQQSAQDDGDADRGSMPGIKAVMDWLDTFMGDTPLLGAGHRVVHGGERFTAPCVITDQVLAALDTLTPLAPLHQPASLAPVRALRDHRPQLRQVACFDTAFHAHMPDVAQRLALPRTITDQGVRRYGFHGLSYEHIARRLSDIAPALAKGRTIVAHLGSGASLCALRDGKSIDTTMGFSVLDGLVMGTRCGHLDPGVTLYLAQALGYDHDRLQHLLYHESGLLGVSGRSADMRDLLAHRDDPPVMQALDLYIYRLAREVAGLVSALDGLDGLVFTAGVGEHTPYVRARLCAALGWLGVRLDTQANDRSAPTISAADSAVQVRVEPADEEDVIRRCVLQQIG